MQSVRLTSHSLSSAFFSEKIYKHIAHYDYCYAILAAGTTLFAALQRNIFLAGVISVVSVVGIRYAKKQAREIWKKMAQETERRPMEESKRVDTEKSEREFLEKKEKLKNCQQVLFSEIQKENEKIEKIKLFFTLSTFSTVFEIKSHSDDLKALNFSYKAGDWMKKKKSWETQVQIINQLRKELKEKTEGSLDLFSDINFVRLEIASINACTGFNDIVESLDKINNILDDSSIANFQNLILLDALKLFYSQTAEVEEEFKKIVIKTRFLSPAAT